MRDNFQRIARAGVRGQYAAISGTSTDESVFLLMALFVASFALGVGLALLTLL